MSTQAFRFELGCVDCGADLALTASGVAATSRATAVLACTACKAEHLVIVGLEVTSRPRFRPVYDTGVHRSRKSRSKTKVPA